MNWRTCLFIFFGNVLFCITTYAQNPISTEIDLDFWNAGLPFMTSYTPEVYKGDAQNWSFAQADNGLIYVGNSAGVLEFDGVSWRTIAMKNSGVVRSLVKNENGTIYVGGSKELGYLKSNEIGEMEYVSLMPKIAVEHHNFTDVWDIRIIGQAVYFISSNYIFTLLNGNIAHIAAKDAFGRSAIFRNELVIIDGEGGLKILRDGKLINAPNSELIGANPALFQYDSESILVIDRFNGSFLFDFKSITPLENNSSNYLKGKFPYDIMLLPNGNILVVTLGHGVIIMNRAGEVINHLSKEKGLISNVVYSAFLDINNDVWLATANGINRVEISSPLRIFDVSSNLNEGVFCTTIHQNEIYAGSHDGLFVYDFTELSIDPSGFKRIEGVRELPRSLIDSGENLWVGDLNGIYLLKNKKVIQFIRPKGNTTGYKLIKSLFYKNLFYVANDQGHLYLLELQENQWELSKPILEVNDRIHHLVEDQDGSVWMATYVDGIYKIRNQESTFKNKTPANFEVTHYNISKGLPALHENSVVSFEGVIYSGTSTGLYKYDKEKDIFKSDPLLNKFYPESKYACGLLTIGADGGLWVPTSSNHESRLFKYHKRRSIEEIEAFKRANVNQVLNINATANDIAFISTPKGIIVYKAKLNPSKKKATLNIRKVIISHDSLLFAGRSKFNRQRTEQSYEQNDIRFEYALSDYDNPLTNQYQYKLVPSSVAWSLWSHETKKDYTNIPEGDYTFKVRAKNLYGHISNEDSYSFTIFPPWYRSWWAYALYGFLALFALWLFAQWRSAQLYHKNVILEGIVKRRTEEIGQKNIQLRHQAEKLKEMDTMKTRLFANISHEFRTPLTLIKGPIEKLEQAQENSITTTNIKMIRRNANRLLNLVNQLLDLSKLDSGKLKLNIAEGDVMKCIRAAASAFGSHAASRKMDYQIKIPGELVWASFDRDKLEKIVYNLLSNAFKFTHDEGRVTIDTTFRSNRLHLKITDNGSGISTDKLPHIFDRFFQVDDSYTKEKAGSGIGLALTKELVELMGGTIYVESEKDRGTRFRVVIPLEEIQSGSIKEKEEIPQKLIDDDLYEPKLRGPFEKQVKILIIEDNNDMRHFIREQLEDSYGILEAVNGKQGLKQARKISPDLIITDLMMPQMDGITLCKKLKTDLATSHIPVIMLTAKAGLENKLEGLETGADEYLTKPFDARELQIRTKNLIEQRQRLRERYSRNISLDPKEITVTSLDEEFLNRILALFEEKYAESLFGVPQMQKELGMGKTTLHSKLKALTNHPPGELLRNFRLQRAKQLLVQNADNISQVAFDVGFNSLSYFTRCFKEYYGTSPSEFLKNNS